MWNKSFLLLPLFLVSLFSFSQEKMGRRIVKTLCSDSLYGRGYVHQGMNKAAEFLKAEMIEIGLQPFLKENKYFQDFSFDVNTFPDTIKVIADGKLLHPGVDFLVDPTSGSFKGNLKMIEVDTTILTDASAFGPASRKINSGEKNAIYINLTGISSPKTHAIIRAMNPLAQMATIIYVSDQRLMWSVGQQKYKYPILHFREDIVSASSSLFIHIEAKFIPGYSCKNVVGHLPSSDSNAKTIVFSAHYDHLGMMGTSPFTKFPGGNDNASGASMLLTLAKYYKKHPSKYNLVFIEFAAEEAGLLGSKYFVENNTMDLSQIKFLINLDIMGSGEEGITAVNGRIFKEKFQLLKDINQEKNYLSTIKPRGEAANSDHYFFYINDVPCFFIYTMGPNKNYHDVFDTYDQLTFSAYSSIVNLLIDFVERL